MTKNEIITGFDHEVIAEYVRTYAFYILNMNDPRGKTKALGKHLQICEDEMLRRGLLTQNEVDRLNA